MCVFVYVCVSVCVFVRARACVSVCLCMHACVRACMCICNSTGHMQYVYTVAVQFSGYRALNTL